MTWELMHGRQENHFKMEFHDKVLSVARLVHDLGSRSQQTELANPAFLPL